MLIAASHFENYGCEIISHKAATMESIEAIAARLRRLRLAYGFQQARAWCEHIGVLETVWNPFERGARRITLDVALKVCAHTGASLDWIYRGMEHTLPMHVIERLRSVSEDDVELTDRRKRA